jgi:hypothetical protein
MLSQLESKLEMLLLDIEHMPLDYVIKAEKEKEKKRRELKRAQQQEQQCAQQQQELQQQELQRHLRKIQKSSRNQQPKQVRIRFSY